MGKPTNETGLVKAIRRAVAEHSPGSWVIKVHGSPYQEAGIPDVLMCVGGRLIALEVKFPRGGESFEHTLSRVTETQWVQIERIREAGGTAEVVTSVESALEVVDAALDKEIP